MKSLHLGRVVVGFLLFGCTSVAQISTFPYSEHFDTIADSTIPVGWETTANRRHGGDFFASLSNPHSVPHCLLSQNSTISQTLTSPAFDFSDRTPDRIQFYIARSSTHLSGIILEALIDSELTYPIPLSDTLKYPGTTAYVLSAIQLPASLANRNEVRFRWRVVGGLGGATATFRIDDISITTLVSNDLAIGIIEILPRLATTQDSLVLKASVKNLGIQTAAIYSVSFFCDLNGNSRPEPSEQFASLSGPQLQAADSTLVTAGYSKLKAGDYRFFAIIVYPADERGSNDTAVSTATIGYPKGSLAVNEFMYAPLGDEPEWVELLNCSADTVNLRNWRISDNNTSSKTFIATNNMFVPPSGYCIVTRDASFILLHPTIQCPVVIANFPALNNTTPDAIVLYEPRLATIDSVAYSPTWGGQGGKSLERIDGEQSSTDARNWGQSNDSTGSSPGRDNSIVRMANDLKIERCSRTLVQSAEGLVPQITIVVRNIGKNSASNYSVSLFNDVDHDTAGNPGELIATMNSTTPLSPADSATFSYIWESIPQGESIVLAFVEYFADQRTTNNSSSITIETGYSSRSVVINEIMYDPLPNQNEWVELFNRTSSPIDLKQWKLRDRPTASGSVNCFAVANQSTILRGREFALIVADTTIFSLFPYLETPMGGLLVIVLKATGGLGFNSDGDDVILEDLTGAQIDSVSYSARWHRPDVVDTKGRSLERINPDLDSNLPANWTTSVLPQGGTPGKANSALTPRTQTSSSLRFSPNPFSPDGDGFEDFCLIQYNLPLSSTLIHIKIYDIKGRLVRTLANSKISGSQGDLVWDGLNEERQRVRIGPYIVLVQATDPAGNASVVLKGVVVVAARL